MQIAIVCNYRDLIIINHLLLLYSAEQISNSSLRSSTSFFLFRNKEELQEKITIEKLRCINSGRTVCEVADEPDEDRTSEPSTSAGCTEEETWNSMDEEDKIVAVFRDTDKLLAELEKQIKRERVRKMRTGMEEKVIKYSR